MNVGSVTKMLTATVARIILQKYGLPPKTTHVWEFMPKHWTIHESMKPLTFYHLLTHKGGFEAFENLDSSIQGWKKFWETGKDPEGNPLVIPPESDYGAYDNGHFSPFRFVLPFIVCPNYMAPYDMLGKEAELDLHSQIGFLSIMRLYLFDKIGMPHGGTNPEDYENVVLGYMWPQNDIPGTDMGHTTEGMGVGGMIISATKLAEFLGKYMWDTTFINEGLRLDMLGNWYGWRPYTDIIFFDQVFRTHNGYAGDIGEEINGIKAEGRTTSEIIIFNNDYQGVLLINSNCPVDQTRVLAEGIQAGIFGE